MCKPNIAVFHCYSCYFLMTLNLHYKCSAKSCKWYMNEFLRYVKGGIILYNKHPKSFTHFSSQILRRRQPLWVFSVLSLSLPYKALALDSSVSLSFFFLTLYLSHLFITSPLYTLITIERCRSHQTKWSEEGKKI